jgi:hypothetical protein
MEHSLNGEMVPPATTLQEAHLYILDARYSGIVNTRRERAPREVRDA